MVNFKPIPIYKTVVWVNKKITYNGKHYTIDDGDYYFLQQIHKILENKRSVNSENKESQKNMEYDFKK